MVKREIIEKKESVDKKVLTEFVNISVASSKIHNIEVEQEQGIFNMRPNLNLFIFGSIGSTKSTLLKQIAEQTKSKKPYTDLTYPALIGSIDGMTRQLIIGASWECRNSLLLLDEFDFGKRKKDDIRALLQLIEGGEYNKKLASFSSPMEEKDGDLNYSFKDGEFNIKTRFALVVATMRYPFTSQNIELKALMTRSVVLAWYPEISDLKKIAHGHSLFKFEDKTPEEKIIRIKRTTYEKILKYVEEKNENGNFLRIVGDCCRIYAVEGKHREDLYDCIIHFQNKKFQSKKPKNVD